jgi:hypothetical protein
MHETLGSFPAQEKKKFRRKEKKTTLSLSSAGSGVLNHPGGRSECPSGGLILIFSPGQLQNSPTKNPTFFFPSL